MQCQPYITADEFINSEYFCSFPTCCVPTGMSLNDLIDLTILEAQAIINSYLGWELCLLPRNDYFIGDNSRVYFTEFIPLDPTTFLSLKSNSIYSRDIIETISSETDNKLYIADKSTGNIKNNYIFKNNKEYNLSYQAGYEIIPSEIKTALKMLIVNIAQRLDNMNLSNPDFSLDKVNIDKSMDIGFGSGKMIKNVVVKAISELSDIPIPVMKILDRFKHNKLS